MPYFGVAQIDARVDGSHKNDFGDEQRDAQISMDAVSQATQISVKIKLVRGESVMYYALKENGRSF